ncbi:MAG: hypothetical protein AABY14_00695, partial [Nanoarchaeota archaeon]
SYAEGRDLRGLVAIVGEEALSERDRRLLKFADEFEKRFVRQGRDENRGIIDTLNLAWDLLRVIPERELNRISQELKKRYYKGFISVAEKKIEDEKLKTNVISNQESL